MRHRRFRLATLSAALLAALSTQVPPAVAAPPADEAQAAAAAKGKESARSWLALTDAGKYAASWDRAASFFKAAVPKAAWEKALTATRKPLGALKARAARSARFARTLPGAPDGEYVEMQFDAAFENKAAALETVTAAKEKDGSWKIAGYLIR